MKHFLVFLINAHIILIATSKGDTRSDYSHKNLDLIPNTIPRSVTHLLLSHNRIRQIQQRNFGRLIHLTYLDISSNLINKLDKMAFKGMTELKILNISSNHLNSKYSFPEGVFQPLSASLLELDLRYNMMYLSYPGEAFEYLTSLRTLKLDCITGKVILFIDIMIAEMVKMRQISALILISLGRS